MSEPVQCPECGAVIPAGHPGGLCPRCALSEALKADGNPDSRGDEVSPAGSGVGRSFGDYELLEEIARGGMGVVYKARQKSLDRIVAIKMLLFGRHSDEDMIRRFKNEAIITANLRHPNIVTVHEVGIEDGRHYIVMDYVPGSNLARFAGHQPLPVKLAVEFVRTIAGAIQHAHECGILHRDLKPSNVLIDPRNEPHVTDFGLARRMDGESSLTLSGQVLGSLSYMSPEQAAAHKVSRASDVYGLGAILYHLLTGRPPFSGATMAETLQQVMTKEVASPRRLNPDVPSDLATVCLKCLEKDPEHRYGSAEDLANDLERWRNQEPIWAQPASGWDHVVKWVKRNRVIASLGSIALLLGALLVGQHFWQIRHREDPEMTGLLRVGPASIAVQPQSQTAPPGSNIAFVVMAAGEGPLSFQWKKDGVKLVDDERVNGAAAPKLRIANVQTEDLGSYTLAVSNAQGLVTTEAASLFFSPPRFAWVQQAGGAGRDRCGQMAVDSQGNLLVSGDFSGTAEFGNAALRSGGDQDIWIAKYSSDGALRWARSAGGPDKDHGAAVTADRTGNVYLAGRISNTATFAHTNLTSAGKGDIFVAKYSPSGELLWVSQAGGRGEDAVYGVTKDNRGGCIITGPFEGTAVFGSHELRGSGPEEFYLARFDADGTVAWAVQGGGPKGDSGATGAVDPGGDCYVTGWFDATATFGDIVLRGKPNERNLFVAKYSNAGDLLWIRKGQSFHLANLGHGLTTDGNRNVYVAGMSGYEQDPKATVSVSSFDDAGFQRWQQKITGLFVGAGCLRIASDEAGNCSVICALKGAATFGNTKVKATETSDVYIANYNHQGLLQWIQKSEGPGVGVGRSIAVGPAGEIYAFGYFSGTEQFGSHQLTSRGDTDIFLAKLIY